MRISGKCRYIGLWCRENIIQGLPDRKAPWQPGGIMREKLKKILEGYGIGADNLDGFLNAMHSVLICMADEEKALIVESDSTAENAHGTNYLLPEEKASQHEPHTYDGCLAQESIERLESAAYEILYLKGSLDKK